MRPIKFRAWNKKTKTMIDCKRVTPIALHPDCSELDGVFLPFHEDLILMQFTGLLDRNGTEVWEGDIVKWLGHEARGAEQLRPVRIMVIGKDWIFDCYALKNIIEGNGTAEVIGNIYKHPHLLEDTCSK